MYLSQVMPPKLECHHWILVFSTSNQGFSLQNMMRKLSNFQQSPLLLVLSDLENNVFGAFLSGVPQIGKEGNFEGTGETFLFKLRPQTKAFNWTGENNFFYRVDNDCLIIGSSKGKFGLWIDRYVIMTLKFIYSEKATKFCEILPLLQYIQSKIRFRKILWPSQNI